MIDKPTVIYDACVLFSAPLRDLLMHLANADLYFAKWSDQIHDEWIENLLRKRKHLKRKDLERTKKLMNENVLDCVVEDYHSITEKLNLPDPNDNHVLAAAIKSESSRIITFNTKDFPRKHLDSYSIEAQNPDDFINEWLKTDYETVCLTVQKLRKSLKKPPKSPSEYLDCLLKQSLPKTVSNLRENLHLI